MQLSMNDSRHMADARPLWTPELVRARLEDACETLRRLPMPRDARPAGARSWWPPIVYDYWETWNGLSDQERRERAGDLNRGRPAAPSSAQVQAMDEALQWLWHVDPPPNRRVLLARCSGWSLRKAARAGGCSHEHVRRVVDRALSQIAQALERGQ